MKDLLVNLSVSESPDPAVDFAVSLAEAFGAHVTAAAFAYDPVVAVSVMGGMPSDFLDAQRVESEQAAEAARARFEQAANRAGIAFESHAFSTGVAGAADQFARMARRFDLSIVRQAEADAGGPEEIIAESAMFQSGRPVIVVPYIHKGGLKSDRVMVCWDGGRAAARAIADAMPLLARAGKVELVMITGEEGKRDEVPGADMGRHLARHGINVEVKRIVAEGNVQETLLSYAADMSADMIVMGGYGHSRLREFILGGVTRSMLASMTVPCFMSP
jgi:nucleotide-binding universal stress UspA family protein